MSEKDKKSVLDKAAQAYLDNTVVGLVIKETQDFVKSGKAAIAGEAIVNAVKDLNYNLVYAGAKANEAIGLGSANDLSIKMCDAAQDSILPAPILNCQAVKDIVAKRGK